MALSVVEKTPRHDNLLRLEEKDHLRQLLTIPNPHADSTSNNFVFKTNLAILIAKLIKTNNIDKTNSRALTKEEVNRRLVKLTNLERL